MRNNSLKEKVAYLQGLSKGLNLNESSAEGKLLVNIVDVLDSFAQEVKSVNMAQLDLEEYVESIDDDLSNLEDEIYSDEEDEERSRYSDDADDDEEEWVEMACPKCRELVSFEADILDEDDEVEVTCPYCREIVYDNTIDIIEDQHTSRYSAGRAGHPGI